MQALDLRETEIPGGLRNTLHALAALPYLQTLLLQGADLGARPELVCPGDVLGPAMSLRVVDLTGTGLSGTVAACWLQFSLMEEVYLGGNLLYGSLPQLGVDAAGDGGSLLRALALGGGLGGGLNGAWG